MTSSENTSLIQGVVSGNVQVAGSATWNIPIWLTLVRQNDGYSAFNESFAPVQLIEGVNQYFNNGMAFYLCGITYIDNSDWYFLDLVSELAALKAFSDAQNADQYDKGYINVFLVAGLQNPGGDGHAGFPNSLINRGHVAVSIQNSRVLAHELGHYFSLRHTFAGGPTVTIPNQPEVAQYVHHPTEPELHPVTLSTGTFTCQETGDLICDTPADPETCNFITCVFDECSTPYDPLGMPYQPVSDLIMGQLSLLCSNRFSPQQNQRMVTMYTGNSNWGFIYDSTVPTCQTLPNDIGLVRRNCKNISVFGSPAPEFTPIEGVDVPLQNNNQACGAITPITDQEGRYTTYNCVYPSYNGSGLLSILPDKNYANNPLNGVSTWDLVLLSKHILGVEPFTSPLQMIAADANNSSTVTTFDIVEIRKVILGITNGMGAGSWRYIPEYCFDDQDFSDEFYNDENPNLPGIQPNPFNALWTNPDETNGQQRTYGGGGAPTSPNTNSWMDHVSINPNASTALEIEPWSLWGVKTGDFNCNVYVDGLTVPLPPDKTFLTPSHNSLSANQEFTLQIRALGDTPVSAWQLGVEFDEDYLEILEVLQGNSGESFSLDNFGLTRTEQGGFRALNYESTGADANLDDKILFKIRMKALQPVTSIGQRFQLKNQVLEQKFYDADGSEIEDMDLQLEVVSGTFGMVGGIGSTTSIDAAKEYRLSVYPIPFTSEIVFDFYLPEDEQVRLSLYDGLGRLVSQSNSPLSKGANSLKMNELANQPVGFYWYLFEAGGQSLYGKLIKN